MCSRPAFIAPSPMPTALATERRKSDTSFVGGCLLALALLVLGGCLTHCAPAHKAASRTYRAEHAQPSAQRWQFSGSLAD